MSPPNWLPPLNFHDEFELSAVAAQLEFPQNNPTLLQDYFLISTNVFVAFSPNNFSSNEEIFPGLSIAEDYAVPCYKLTSPTLAHQAISEILNDMSIPFELNQVSWRERHFIGDINFQENVDNLSESIWNFACSLTEKTYNEGFNILPFNLSIIKMVTIPDDQHDTWSRWYDDNMMADPDFEEDYMEAISRPRTAEELLYDVNPDGY
ncbi:hypothetical protein ACH5RR_009624 [Cinchona calisaya]|uniref:Uncharacterized protein n=1 Tax=Cinchona calisaya TaxID=153742 RepID=A0ABD3AHD3_9GENT